MGRGELRLVAVAGAIVLVGLLVEWAGGGVDAPGARSQSAGAFLEKSIFCPSPPDVEDSAMQVFASAVGNEDTSVGFEPKGGSKDLPAGSEYRHLQSDGSTLVGYGAPLAAGVAGSFSVPTEGTVAAGCSSSTSATWDFPFGTSDLGFDERILLYNPFPDEAVARVVIADETGERIKAGLDDVPISAGSTEEVLLNEHVQAQPFVSTRVEAVRGRFVAWRAIFHKPEDGARGVDMTLGASRAADTWYFPEGVIGAGAAETIALSNPSDSEAVVNISVVTGDRPIASKDLVGIKVARETAELVRLNSIPGLSDKDLVHASAIVTTENGVDIFAERRITAETGELEGVSSEVGSVTTSQYWMLAPPASNPQIDTISVLNPTNKTAHFDVILKSKDGATQPDNLAQRKVPAGLRVQVSIGAFTKGEPVVAVVRADQKVVAERSGRSPTDTAAVMGTPTDAKIALLGD